MFKQMKKVMLLMMPLLMMSCGDSTPVPPKHSQFVSAPRTGIDKAKIKIVGIDGDIVVINVGSDDFVMINDVFSLIQKRHIVGSITIKEVHRSMAVGYFYDALLEDYSIVFNGAKPSIGDFVLKE